MFGELVSVKTEENIKLVGFLSPCETSTNKVFVMSHGRGGTFYSGFSTFLPSLVKAAHECGYNFLGVSDRGSGFFRIYDEFETCIVDYAKWVEFCKQRKYQKIILGAHSYGPSKIAYYYSQGKPKSVNGLFFLAPTDTYGMWKKQVGGNAGKYLNLAEELIRIGKESDLMPKEAYYKPISAKSYHSLYGKNSKMHIFDFHNPNFDFALLKNIELPVLVVMGSKDEYPYDEKPAKKIKVLQKILQKPILSLIDEANHVFTNKEKELAYVVKNWLNSLQF